MRFASKQMEEAERTSHCVLNNRPRAMKAMQICWEMLGAVESEKKESQSKLQILEEPPKKVCFWV